jgi:peroxiredoxin
MQNGTKLLLSILISIFSVISAEELSLGSEIPLADTKLQDISGDYLTLNETLGEAGLLVIFSCNTCPWVIRWNDRYVSITDQYKSKGINVIALNSNEAYRDGDESLKAMQKFAKKNDYNFPYVVDSDSKLARAFGATRTPHIYLFNADGKLVYRGAIDDNARNAKAVKEPYLATAIDQMLTGKEITNTSTKALGCTIKFASK